MASYWFDLGVHLTEGTNFIHAEHDDNLMKLYIVVYMRNSIKIQGTGIRMKDT